MIRALSQAAYPSWQRTPIEVVQTLDALKEAFVESYEFWPADVSLSDRQVFNEALIAGQRQVTDVYLLALAMRHEATLVSFDRTLAWQAVQGASASHDPAPSHRKLSVRGNQSGSTPSNLRTVS